MMTRIDNIKDLRAAKMRSRKRIQELEQIIRDDVQEIKNDLRPVNVAGNAIKSMFTSDRHSLVGESMGIGVNALIKHLLFRRSGFLTKTLLAFVARNVATNVVSKNSDNILDWVQERLRKLKSKHHHNGHYYDESTADVGLDS